MIRSVMSRDRFYAINTYFQIGNKNPQDKLSCIRNLSTAIEIPQVPITCQEKNYLLMNL